MDKKVRDGIQFLDQGTWYALADLENLTANEFDRRIYLEAEVDDEGKRKRLQIFFKELLKGAPLAPFSVQKGYKTRNPFIVR
ncbi:hypothetical protein [Mucilaginibacter sp. OK098]|uniref:hypothetical protein n=1 Tax=Mucilaginibacter sp. OK098 TaxID=1855297 RepID=UPI00091967E3|nr:hypothetical protein [Mucilaginibacter sp. OK098]SHN37050.1 hypothetical protein SAMN05216524_11455 [Mucilaginibacter sp. OK098]